MTQAQALQFVDQLASGSYAPQELEELRAYLRSAPRQEQDLFFDVYYQAIRALPEHGPVNREFQQRLYSLYPGKTPPGQADTDEPPAGTPQIVGTYRVAPVRRLWVAAAAAVAATVVTTALWQRHTHADLPLQPTITAAVAKPSVILPGGNKAVLTLAGGKQVVLNGKDPGYVMAVVGAQRGSLPEAAVYNTVTTPRGGQYETDLPDGSRVWLNSSSSLRFPTAFGGATREVDVTGEAYFEVARDAAHPFKVRTATFNVDVLGTDFNVNVYGDEGASRTTLLNGSVRVLGKVLEPGQQAVLDQATGVVRVVSGADLEEVIAWKNGNLQFHNADIPTIMRQVARWYDVDVVYEGAVPTGHFTGRVSRATDLTGMLRIFALSQIHFRIEGRKIIVVS
jgi:ferric-dicitrate binding protein FerR (iron transport regulator)